MVGLVAAKRRCVHVMVVGDNWFSSELGHAVADAQAEGEDKEVEMGEGGSQEEHEDLQKSKEDGCGVSYMGCRWGIASSVVSGAVFILLMCLLWVWWKVCSNQLCGGAWVV